MSWFDDIAGWCSRTFRAGGGSTGGAGATESFDEQEERNVAAGIMAIRKCEGTDRQIAYRALYGYHPTLNPTRLFDSYSEHPRQKFWFDGSPIPAGYVPAAYTYTTAAGAGQFTWTTWKRIAPLIGATDFSPAAQERGFRFLISEAGAMADLKAGRLEAFANKCSPIWASLPFSTSGQPKKSMEFFRKAYRAAGGEEAK